MTTILDQFRNGEFVLPSSPVGAILYGLAFAFFAWLIGRAVRLAVHRVLAYDKRALVDRTTVRFLGQLAQIGVYLFAFISYAHLVPALAHLGTAWLASVSVISVVVGLAAQNTLGNLVAGISLLLYRPFNVGDRLQVTGPAGLETGEVESLNLGYTVLKTDDNRRVVVPNSLMASQTTVNLSGDDPRVLCSVILGVQSESDIDRARAILMHLACQSSKALSVEGCPVTQVSPAGIMLTLTAWCASPSDAATLKTDLLEQACKQFARDGILLAAPRTAVTLLDTQPRDPKPKP
jgi:small conductance mechanosensitive channel